MDFPLIKLLSTISDINHTLGGEDFYRRFSNGYFSLHNSRSLVCSLIANDLYKINGFSEQQVLDFLLAIDNHYQYIYADPGHIMHFSRDVLRLMSDNFKGYNDYYRFYSIYINDYVNYYIFNPQFDQPRKLSNALIIYNDCIDRERHLNQKYTINGNEEFLLDFIIKEIESLDSSQNPIKLRIKTLYETMLNYDGEPLYIKYHSLYTTDDDGNEVVVFEFANRSEFHLISNLINSNYGELEGYANIDPKQALRMRNRYVNMLVDHHAPKLKIKKPEEDTEPSTQSSQKDTEPSTQSSQKDTERLIVPFTSYISEAERSEAAAKNVFQDNGSSDNDYNPTLDPIYNYLPPEIQKIIFTEVVKNNNIIFPLTEVSSAIIKYNILQTIPEVKSRLESNSLDVEKTIVDFLSALQKIENQYINSIKALQSTKQDYIAKKKEKIALKKSFEDFQTNYTSYQAELEDIKEAIEDILYVIKQLKKDLHKSIVKFLDKARRYELYGIKIQQLDKKIPLLKNIIFLIQYVSSGSVVINIDENNPNSEMIEIDRASYIDIALVSYLIDYIKEVSTTLYEQDIVLYYNEKKAEYRKDKILFRKLLKELKKLSQYEFEQVRGAILAEEAINPGAIAAIEQISYETSSDSELSEDIILI